MINYAVVAITGIGIEGHIGHDRHLGMPLLEQPDGAGNQAVLVEAFGAILSFESIGHLGE